MTDTSRSPLVKDRDTAEASPKQIIAEIMARVPCVDPPGHNMLASEIIKKLDAGGYAVVPKELVAVAAEFDKFAWSSLTADCKAAGDNLNDKIKRMRAALKAREALR